ncbi:MAG: hypothetical protein ACE1Z4_11840 [Gammaproteobacteria bacterium]
MNITKRQGSQSVPGRRGINIANQAVSHEGAEPEELVVWTIEDFGELLPPHKALNADGDEALWDRSGPLEYEHSLLGSFND